METIEFKVQEFKNMTLNPDDAVADVNEKAAGSARSRFTKFHGFSESISFSPTQTKRFGIKRSQL